MSISEFFSMGGFGLFVWSSMGITFLFFFIEVIYLKRKYHGILQRLQRFHQSRNGEQA